MRLELTGRHVDTTPAIRRMVEGKLARLERLFIHAALSAQVVLTREKRAFRADITLHARGEKFLHGVSGAATWDLATAQAVDKIIQQARKVKGKWEEWKRRGPKAAPLGEEATAGPAALETSARPRARMPRMFRRLRRAIKAMSVVDAIREVEGSGEGIVVFRDGERDRISVLYRGTSGELTLVETEA